MRKLLFAVGVLLLSISIFTLYRGIPSLDNSMSDYDKGLVAGNGILFCLGLLITIRNFPRK